jgi:hypothetical protein
MNVTHVLVVILAGARAKCVYTNWMGTLSCYGVNVSSFPDVYEYVRQSVGHIDIIQTNLSELPRLKEEEWPNLTTMDIRDNPTLACERVFWLRDSLPRVLITSDCHRSVIERRRTISTDGWAAFIVLLPILIVSVVGALVGRKRCKDKRYNKANILKRKEECTAL